jgi:hypothetical protein
VFDPVKVSAVAFVNEPPSLNNSTGTALWQLPRNAISFDPIAPSIEATVGRRNRPSFHESDNFWGKSEEFSAQKANLTISENGIPCKQMGAGGNLW